MIKNRKIIDGSKSLIILIIFMIMFAMLSKNVSAENIEIKICTQAPVVNQKIETELSGIDENNIVYQWTVAGNNTEIETNYYIPTVADYESWIEVNVFDKTSGNKVGSDHIFFSRLPVVYIETEGNQPVEDRSKYVSGKMIIQGNALFSEEQYSGKIEIKGRGTSSWHYDKKPYKLKLGKKTNLFNFGKSKHYVLLANYLDPSLMRNAIGYELSKKLGLVATDSTWVDVVFNGEYVGNYLLAEHVRIGKQLIDIQDWEDTAEETAEKIVEDNPADFSKSTASDLEDAMTEDLSWITTGYVTFNGKNYPVGKTFDISGGYLYELDTDYDDEISHFMTDNGIKVAVIKPEYLSTNAEMMDFARNYLQNFEDAIRSADGYNDAGQHYTSIADIDSMVAYWLSMEIIGNDDAGSRSRYCYKPVNDKLQFGPSWDFDISSGAMRSFLGPIGWNPTGTIAGWVTKQDIWKEFVDDPYFQMKAQEKYWEIRDYLEELIKDGGIIDSYAEYVYESGTANELLWTNDEYIPRSFTGSMGDVQVFKRFLTRRIHWLDKMFASENSTTLSLIAMLSNHPYIKSSLIRLSIQNGFKDSENHGAKYLIAKGEGVLLKAQLMPGHSASVYVNGIFYGEFSKSELNHGINIPNSALTEKDGKKNVISVIAEFGETTLKNYITVREIDSHNEMYDNTAAKELLCGHDRLIPIESRTATKERYGLNACWYCPDCQHYFADDQAQHQINISEVIVSVNTTKRPIGILTKLNRLLRKEVSFWPF